MTSPISELPPAPRLTPRERVAKWEPLLAAHGWAVQITHTDERARLEAEHPSGSTLMITSGRAGREGANGTTKLYVLPNTHARSGWLGVRRAGMEEFIRTQTVAGSRKRVPSKCQCRTGAGRPKVRYATLPRATRALEEARAQRAREGQADKAECRIYRCPDDDRVWHTSSRPVWRPAVGESPLWAGEASCA